jgi:hypothetical protein
MLSNDAADVGVMLLLLMIRFNDDAVDMLMIQ